MCKDYNAAGGRKSEVACLHEAVVQQPKNGHHHAHTQKIKSPHLSTVPGYPREHETTKIGDPATSNQIKEPNPPLLACLSRSSACSCSPDCCRAQSPSPPPLPPGAARNAREGGSDYHRHPRSPGSRRRCLRRRSWPAPPAPPKSTRSSARGALLPPPSLSPPSTTPRPACCCSRQTRSPC